MSSLALDQHSRSETEPPKAWKRESQVSPETTLDSVQRCDTSKKKWKRAQTNRALAPNISRDPQQEGGEGASKEKKTKKKTTPACCLSFLSNFRFLVCTQGIETPVPSDRKGRYLTKKMGGAEVLGGEVRKHPHKKSNYRKPIEARAYEHK